MGAKRLDTYGEVICGPFGSAIKSEDYITSGIPLLRIINITESGYIDLEKIKFISPRKALRLSSTQVHPGDIVVSQRGTLGLPAIVPPDYPVWNISANLLAVRRFKKINPEFVQLFIGSLIGRRLIQRISSGQVQGKITTEDLASLLILKQRNEDNLVNNMAEARQARKEKLAKAEALLAGIDELVINALNIPDANKLDRRAFAILLKTLKDSRPLGANYFHPERMEALTRIRASTVAKRCVNIIDVASFQRDIEKVPANEEYIGLADVESNIGELSSRSHEQTAQGQCFRFRQGDILFARLRPYLNKVWHADYGGVCSTEFHVIRIRNSESDLSPHYVAAILRSSLTVAQTRHMMTGNTHPRLANDDVVDLQIPIPPVYVQKQIVEEIDRRRNEARALRKMAQDEWVDAKNRFESELLREDVEK